MLLKQCIEKINENADKYALNFRVWPDRNYHLSGGVEDAMAKDAMHLLEKKKGLLAYLEMIILETPAMRIVDRMKEI